MHNGNVFYSTNYQTPVYTPIKDNSLHFQNNSINMNSLSTNRKSINQSPSNSFRFEVPKQRENINYVARTPPPSYNRRNYININLSDNRKFKEICNSPVYHKLRGMDSINNTSQIDNNSINTSLRYSNYNFYQISPIINIGQNIPRNARTPEPIRINNSYNSNINSINYSSNNISFFNNDSNYKSVYQNNPNNPNISQNSSNIGLNNSIIIKKVPDINNNNYLKPNNNIKIIKLSDFNQNKNYENIINIKNNINQNNNYENNLLKNYVNFNQNHNFSSKINIKKHHNLNKDDKFQGIVNIRKIHNYPVDNYKKYITCNNISNIVQSPDYQKQNNSKIQTNYNSPNNSYPGINVNLNQNIPPNVPKNHINIIKIPQNKYIFHYGEHGIIRRSYKDITITKPIPDDNFNLREFQIIKQIGEGTNGIIYRVNWIKNNELYALKKVFLYGEELNNFRNKVKIIQNFIKKTQHNGVIRIYGDKCVALQRPNEYNYYIIMELGEKDWEREIIIRSASSLFYSEYELFEIIKQLVKTLSLMQKNNITHRDIKPQNILICKNVFKICDYDEIKMISGNGPILQSVRGSELYMSPILFYAYHVQAPSVYHNTYKSDVFSLGMTILLACTLSATPLCDIRELKNMNIISQIINKALINRYSQNLINLIIKMLQIDENKRLDFIELEDYISKIWPN